MSRRLAKLALAVTIAAPGWSATIGDEQVVHWQKAAGGEAAALHFLIGSAWIEGEASERGLAVTNAEVRDAVDEQPHDGLGRTDLVYRARVDLLAARIRDQIVQPAAQGVTPEQIEAYVQANPRPNPEQRSVRLVQARSRAQAMRAEAALKRGQVWRSVAKRYSTIAGGGAPRTLEPDTLPERVENAIVKAPKGALTRYGEYVFKITAITPGGPMPLEQQRATAWELLSSQAQQHALDAFSLEFRAKWLPRTTCGPAYAAHPDCGKPPNGQVTP